MSSTLTLPQNTILPKVGESVETYVGRVEHHATDRALDFLGSAVTRLVQAVIEVAELGYHDADWAASIGTVLTNRGETVRGDLWFAVADSLAGE